MLDRISRVLVSLLVGVSLASCSKSQPAPQEPRPLEPVVMTSFYPTAYFASRIAQGAVAVRCPLPDGADPAFWQPTPAVIEDYQRARLIVLNGAEFEKWVDRVSLPRSRVVDTTAGVKDQLLRLDRTFTHSHGTTGEHSHKGLDGHTWLSPTMARAQSLAIRDAMTNAWPEHQATFDAGFEALDRDLASLADRLEQLSPAVSAATVLCSHPAYNYLAREFGWAIQNLALDHGEPLDEEALAQVRELVEESGSAPEGVVKIMLWESSPLDATAEQLDDRFGLVSVVFSPCESDPGEAGGRDYLVVMHANIDRLADALGTPRP